MTADLIIIVAAGLAGLVLAAGFVLALCGQLKITITAGHLRRGPRPGAEAGDRPAGMQAIELERKRA